MKRASFQCVVYLAAIGMFLSGMPLNAADAAVSKTADVALNGDGILVGTVLTADAKPVSGATVSVKHSNKTIATVVSNEEGQFSVRGLRNGSHIVQCGSVQQPVRFWSSNAAPPSAANSMSVVVGDGVVRGQDGGLNLVPIGLIAGATAIVLVTTVGADDPAPPASP